MYFSTIEREANDVILRYQEKEITIGTQQTAVESCAFSHDDSAVVCADRDGVIYVCRVATGELIRRVKLTIGDVKSITVIPGECEGPRGSFFFGGGGESRINVVT